MSSADLTSVAWAYYFFSVQFRENLEIARTLYPADRLLRQLAQEECNTDNLSPWPRVANTGEKLNHDEFMKRLLRLSPINREAQLQSRGSWLVLSVPNTRGRSSNEGNQYRQL